MTFRLLNILVLILTLCLSAVEANAAKAILKAVKTNYGMKIDVEGVNTDYKVTYADGLLTMSFEEDVDFQDTAVIKKASPDVDRVVIDPKHINIFFTRKDVEVEKFTDSKRRGVNIFIGDSSSKDKKQDANAKKNSQKISLTQEDTQSGARLVFDWSEDIGAAAFAREDRIWIVFDKTANFDFDKSVLLPGIKQENSILDAAVISMSYDVDNNKLSNLTMYREGTKWIAEFSNKAIKPQDIRVMSRPYAAPRPRVELEFDSKARPAVRFKDPYVGDDIAVVTTLDSATGVNINYGFVDFRIFKSYQGAAVALLSDALLLRENSKSIYIEGASSLNIAPRVNRKSEKKFEGADLGFKLDTFVEDYKSILSLKSYEVNDAEFNNKLWEIRHALAETESSEARAKVLANWALFDLANGFNAEGLIVIKMIKQENPEFAGTYNMQLIETALHFMDHDYLTAYKVARAIDISEVPISLRKEVRMWQAITGYNVSDSSEFFYQVDPTTMYLDDTNSFLSEYTQKFMMEFGLVIASYKIADRRVLDAKPIIDKLTDMKLKGRNANRLHIISAAYYSAKDDVEKALKEYDDCASDLSDRMNRAVCRYKKAKLAMDAQRMKPEEFTRELEQVSLIWRGDELEVDALKDLGDAYYEQKDYVDALRSWKKIVEYYPYSPDALMLSRKIGETFVNFFTTTKDQDISHIQAVAMFYEFEDLVPIGEVGDEVVVRFADHLIALDLLDKAAALLNHQIMHRLKGNRREEVINKLAEVYIMNQEPALAIDVIAIGDLYEELPDHIGIPRKYIHAQAYADNEEDYKAFALLKNDYSPEADTIKSQIYWRNQNWKEFNKYIEPRIYEIRDLQGEISKKDAEKVLKLSISYLILDEKQLMKDLLQDFLPRLPMRDPKAELLNILAQTWESMNDNSIDALKDTKTIESEVRELINILNSLDKPQ